MNKTCRVCGEDKPLDQFHKAPRNTDGHHHRCKKCAYVDLTAKRNDPARREQFSRYARKGNLKRYYGITPEDYDRLFAEQNKSCAICRTTQFRRLCIDHDHTTGAVRGLLCDRCNTAIGFFDDDISKIKNALSYLEKFSIS